jgi:hypothetical protein
VGDLDGDGHDDIVVGSQGDDTDGTNAGAVYVMLGPLSGTIDLSAADAKLTGEAAYDQAGFAVAGGDLDGDGIGDILVGAHTNDAAADGSGSVYLLHGPVTGSASLGTADAILVGESLMRSDDIGAKLNGLLGK